MMTPSSRLLAAIALLSLPSCVSDLGGVPVVGECAERPDGIYTYGTIGIGTCLSGPTDARFLHADGEAWLAISNADPFRDFSGGSVLLLPADQLYDLRGDIDIADLEAYAVDTEPYIGRIGLLPGSEPRALVPGRLSDSSFVSFDDDRAWHLDLSNPRRPRYGSPSFVPTKADPYAAEVDPTSGLAFVLETTAASVSVVDMLAQPLDLVDTAPAARVVTRPFQPGPNSSALADLDVALLPNASLSTNQTWTVTHVPDTARMWVPTADGLYRYLQRDGVWEPVPFGLDIELDRVGLARIQDPFLTRRGFEEGDVLSVLFSDGTDLRRAQTDGTAGGWAVEAAPLLTAPGGGLDRLSAPTIAQGGSVSRLYVDAGPSDDPLDRRIYQATSPDGVQWSLRTEPLIEPPPGFLALAQPVILRDPHSDALRMWVSMHDGERWSIGHAVSLDDGRAWTEPEEILATPNDIGGVFVVAVAGEYRMWFSEREPNGWVLRSGVSVDGVRWPDLQRIADLDVPIEVERPPRIAMQPAGSGGWRVTRQPDEVRPELAVPGVTWPSQRAPQGFTLRVAAGHAIGTSLLPNSQGGVFPGALLSFGGGDRAFVTAVDGSGRPRLAVVAPQADDSDGGSWEVVADDLIPAGGGGNVAGALSPSVAAVPNGGLAMVYAVEDAAGRRTMRLATSTDGVSWTPRSGDLLGDLGGWASNRREPGTLQIDGDTWTLWFGADDGVRWRIGRAQSTDGGATWTLLPGRNDPWSFGLGDAGTFDDSGVRTPGLTREDGQDVLYYSGFDGTTWRLGRATLDADGSWQRHTSPITRRPHPVLSEIPGSFATRGVRYAVPGELRGEPVVLYAGSDGRAWRTAAAHRTPLGVFPAHRPAQPGDRFVFETFRGRRGRSQISLTGTIDGFTLPGTGGRRGVGGFGGQGAFGPGGIGGPGGPGGAVFQMAPGGMMGAGPMGGLGMGFGFPFGGGRDGPSDAVVDAPRGRMYVSSTNLAGLIVVDIRDDSTPTFRDENAFGIEAVLRFDSMTGNTGLQALSLGPDGTLYAAMRAPDAIGVIDISDIEDQANPRVIDGRLRATLPMKDRTKDRGEETFARISGAGVAHLPGEDLILAAHFRDNSLSVFDARLGPAGTEIRYIRDLTENPHIIRIAPSGDYAVILGYLSDDVDRGTSSSLVIVDLRPDSPTRFEPLARITNR